MAAQGCTAAEHCMQQRTAGSELAAAAAEGCKAAKATAARRRIAAEGCMTAKAAAVEVCKQ
jgi:hypothetical protein